jgi:PUA domain protein
MMVKIKNRHRLKSKEIRQLIEQLKQNFSSEFFKESDSVETGEYENIKLLFVNDEADFMFQNEKIIFTIHGIERFRPKNKFVTVDMGAVKFVTNGADVMAPGITDADNEIVKGDQVWIRDEKNMKALAVGIAIVDGEAMIEQNKGKAIKIIHWVGDPVWQLVAKSL